MERENTAKRQYAYYSVLRPVSIGTYPKERIRPVGFENFDSRKWVDEGHTLAWGILYYPAPLSREEQEEYELCPNLKNPDIEKFWEAVIEEVGELEDCHCISANHRYTERDKESGAYKLRTYITSSKLLERYRLARE